MGEKLQETVSNSQDKQSFSALDSIKKSGKKSWESVKKYKWLFIVAYATGALVGGPAGVAVVAGVQAAGQLIKTATDVAVDHGPNGIIAKIVNGVRNSKLATVASRAYSYIKSVGRSLQGITKKIIENPVQSLLVAGAAALIIIGTGGAAAPYIAAAAVVALAGKVTYDVYQDKKANRLGGNSLPPQIVPQNASRREHEQEKEQEIIKGTVPIPSTPQKATPKTIAETMQENNTPSLDKVVMRPVTTPSGVKDASLDNAKSPGRQ